MSKYIILFRFTPKGIEQIKECPARVEAAKQLFRDMNAEVKDFYAVMVGSIQCSSLKRQTMKQ